MGEEVLFWTVAPIMVIAALSLLFARKAVHIAMAVVVVMVGLAVLYFALAAPFLGVVQIIVYTGAVMMLFLFVLMLVGVDTTEGTVVAVKLRWASFLAPVGIALIAVGRTPILAGAGVVALAAFVALFATTRNGRAAAKELVHDQRWIGSVAATGVATLLLTVLSRVTMTFGALSPDPRQTNPDAIADYLFTRTLLVMEVLGVLLITAAVGALVLTHLPKLHPRRTQAELQAARVADGSNPVNKMMPGVYARHNALDIPALDPEGKPIEESVSRVLKARKQSKDGKQWRAITEGDDT